MDLPSSGCDDEDVAVAKKEPDSDDDDPLPPLPHEQAGRPSREISAQTLAVYPRNAANIPGASAWAHY